MAARRKRDQSAVELDETTVLGRFGRRLARMQRDTTGLGVAAGAVAVLCGLDAIHLARAGFGGGLPMAVVSAVAVVITAGTVTLPLARRRLDRRTREVAGAWAGAVLAEARGAVDDIVAAWPRMGGLVGAEAPGPVLNRALWDLAGDLIARTRVSDAEEQVALARSGLAGDDPVAGLLAGRAAALAGAGARLDERVVERVGRLSGLAEMCRSHLAEQAALASATEAARQADLVLAGDLGGEDLSGYDTAELAERTEAVLRAYRELRLGVAG